MIGPDLEYSGSCATRLYRWQATFTRDESNEEELFSKLITNLVRAYVVRLIGMLTDYSHSEITTVASLKAPRYCCIPSIFVPSLYNLQLWMSRSQWSRSRHNSCILVTKTCLSEAHALEFLDTRMFLK